MPRSLGLLLVVWNVVLSALLGWSLLGRGQADVNTGNGNDQDTLDLSIPARERDTTGLRDARIAYFFMDSLRLGLDLLKERTEQYRREGQRLEGTWQREYSKAQARYQELVAKDHTYSTQAELKADQQELEALDRKIGELKASGEERMARMEAEILQEIAKEVEGFLKQYNEQAGFDYIISIEPGGQVWVGTPDLDITTDVLNGLNGRHRAKKATTAK